jgi:hypothetical protein
MQLMHSALLLMGEIHVILSAGCTPTNRMQYPYQYLYQPEVGMHCQHSSSYLSHHTEYTECPRGESSELS